MKQIRTFMLGWEFPPFISGGLGTACYGLTKAMDKLGAQIIFVLPKAPPIRFSGSGCSQFGLKGLRSFDPQQSQFDKIHHFHNVKFRDIPSTLRPYAKFAAEQAQESSASAKAKPHESPGRKTRSDYAQGEGEFYRIESSSENYGSDIHYQVYRYAEKAAGIAQEEDFQIVHAHDWMTFPAGMTVARRSGKPLIVQVHSTEFDRSGENVNQTVYDIERTGMHAADKVVAVSRYTRNLILERYGVSPGKTEVVYNGADYHQSHANLPDWNLPVKREKIVLFLGRITMQKGPEYFLRAARKVLDKMDNVKFVMAGDGDLLYRSIDLAAQLRIGHKVFFTKFLRGDDVRKAYKMADLYVMPSVSEPFGIAPLEALQHGVPVLISKQSGIGEVLRNVLKVDFWDIDQMADKMAAVLKYPPLNFILGSEGSKEIRKFNWQDSAGRILAIYQSVLQSHGTISK